MPEMGSSSAINIVLESDDDEAETCEEKLFMFLYNSRAHHRAPELVKLFNEELSLQRIIANSNEYLHTHLEEYATVSRQNSLTINGVRYVYPFDLATEKHD